MRKALKSGYETGLPVISHCEDTTICEGAINEGKISQALSLKGIPTIAEDLNIARECLLSLMDDVPVHIAHISTKTGVDLVRHYKSLGAKITAETCPHYFSLTQDIILTKGANAKMNPPLRTEKDRKAIIEGLIDGTIDVIATDHAPHSKEEKGRPLSEAPNGIIGLETALAVSIKYLVKQNGFSLQDVLKKMSDNPRKILNLPSNDIEIGQKADFILFDPNKEYILDINNLHSKSKNTPFDGETLCGAVYYTFVDGVLKNKNGKLI
jgi:dihydroorotase